MSLCAIQAGESPELAARREAEEEIGPLPPIRVTSTEVQECGGGWEFYVVSADVDREFRAFCVRGTEATGIALSMLPFIVEKLVFWCKLTPLRETGRHGIDVMERV
jgi:8-oxo-dGTP pyrophosphatase MutT (NUDIX family)